MIVVDLELRSSRNGTATSTFSPKSGIRRQIARFLNKQKRNISKLAEKSLEGTSKMLHSTRLGQSTGDPLNRQGAEAPHNRRKDQQDDRPGPLSGSGLLGLKLFKPDFQATQAFSDWGEVEPSDLLTGMVESLVEGCDFSDDLIDLLRIRASHNQSPALWPINC